MINFSKQNPKSIFRVSKVASREQNLSQKAAKNEAFVPQKESAKQNKTKQKAQKKQLKTNLRRNIPKFKCLKTEILNENLTGDLGKNITKNIPDCSLHVSIIPNSTSLTRKNSFKGNIPFFITRKLDTRRKLSKISSQKQRSNSEQSSISSFCFQSSNKEGSKNSGSKMKISNCSGSSVNNNNTINTFTCNNSHTKKFNSKINDNLSGNKSSLHKNNTKTTYNFNNISNIKNENYNSFLLSNNNNNKENTENNMYLEHLNCTKIPSNSRHTNNCNLKIDRGKLVSLKSYRIFHTHKINNEVKVYLTNEPSTDNKTNNKEESNNAVSLASNNQSKFNTIETGKKGGLRVACRKKASKFSLRDELKEQLVSKFIHNRNSNDLPPENQAKTLIIESNRHQIKQTAVRKTSARTQTLSSLLSTTQKIYGKKEAKHTKNQALNLNNILNYTKISDFSSKKAGKEDKFLENSLKKQGKNYQTQQNSCVKQTNFTNFTTSNTSNNSVVFQENKGNSNENCRDKFFVVREGVNERRNINSELPPELPEIEELEYTSEILQNLLQEEKDVPNHLQINHRYFSFQPEINPQMRTILIDWLVEVHQKFFFDEETIFITIQIIDTYLSVKKISREKLQLLGVAALSLASKHNEIKFRHMQEYSFITDFAYSTDEILKFENEVFSALEFNLLFQTQYSFYRVLLEKLGVLTEEKHINFGLMLIECFMLCHISLSYSNSCIAISAIYLTMKYFGISEYQKCYSSELFNIKNNSEGNDAVSTVKNCARDICCVVNDLSNSKFQAVFKKFYRDKFSGVGEILCGN